MRRALIAFAALPLLVACGGNGAEFPENEQAYLDQLSDAASEQGSGIRGLGDQDNLDLGYAVCDDIDNGMAPTEVVQSLQQGDETPISKVASDLVGAAQVHLCEEG